MMTCSYVTGDAITPFFSKCAIHNYREDSVDYKDKSAQITSLSLNGLKNMMGKGENADFEYFLLFSKMAS